MKFDKAFIIGGAGFIGSHVVDVCIKSNMDVCVYDNFSTGKRAFLEHHPEINIVEGDILDLHLLAATMKSFKPDLVFHLAAIHHIPTCENEPTQALRVNVEGTESVLEACSKMDISKIVFTSTGALYDPATEDSLNESSPVKVTDIYSISKYTCEKLIQYYVNKFETKAIVARLFNTVGRRETNSHVVPAVMNQLISGKRQILLGNQTPRRDYIHVEDVAEALVALAKSDTQASCDVFNIGSGTEYSVRQLIELISEVIEEPLDIKTNPDLVRKVDRKSQLANINKIQSITNWSPSRNLKQALSEIWIEENSKH